MPIKLAFVHHRLTIMGCKYNTVRTLRFFSKQTLSSITSNYGDEIVPDLPNYDIYLQNNVMNNWREGV